MKKVLILCAMAWVAVGCSGSNAGEPPPAKPPMTQAEIDAMPPQARAAMEAAQRRGEEAQRTRGINDLGNR